MLIGIDKINQIKQNILYLKHPIPKDLWKELIEEKIIDKRCPL